MSDKGKGKGYYKRNGAHRNILSRGVKAEHHKRMLKEDFDGMSPIKVKVSKDAPKNVPHKRKYKRVEYNFLKNIGIVNKYIKAKNPELKRGRLELILYLHSEGAFPFRVFNEYFRCIGIYQDLQMREMINQGWIVKYSNKMGAQPALYTITGKAKTLVRHFYEFLLGDKEIPEDPTINPLAKKSRSTNDRFYMELIKKMNQNTREEEE